MDITIKKEESRLETTNWEQDPSLPHPVHH
jgi:hypothetical protein